MPQSTGMRAGSSRSERAADVNSASCQQFSSMGNQRYFANVAVVLCNVNISVYRKDDKRAQPVTATASGNEIIYRRDTLLRKEWPSETGGVPLIVGCRRCLRPGAR